MKLIVIACWLAFFVAIVFHFRRVGEVRDFFRGFADVWRSLWKAEDLLTHGNGAYDSGGITACILLFLLALATLVCAIVTVCIA